ncbi:regulator of G-protein signaling 7-like isoform X3 [Pomacea canaliculata]|nr:regulator of G-protein signaling 7-like isoform X3 [Pomacea canaliculata]
MERLIQKMQHAKDGVPVKSQKTFLTIIPSVFTGADMITWLKRHLKISDEEYEEAQHLATLFCQHGYIFPVTDAKVLVVKDDASLYRFQNPYYWPSQSIDPDNVAYAIHLTKRSMRNKQKHGLEEYEQLALVKLQKMLCDKREFIESQAQDQVKIAKERKRTDKAIADSQERAFWRIHRPPPGQTKYIEEGPKRNFQPSQMAARRIRKDLLLKEVLYLRKALNMCRVKKSQAIESYRIRAELYHDNDHMLQAPLPSNPWISEDTGFWDLCDSDYPTEMRIRLWSLSFRELLKDPLGVREFETFLKKEYSGENLRFWCACEDLKFTPLSNVRNCIQTIYREFLTPGSPHEVNIDSKTNEKVQQNLQCEKLSRFTFDPAQEHIFVLMKKDSYPRFLRSEQYKTVLANALQPEGKRRFFNFGSRKKATLTPSPKPKRRGSASSENNDGEGPTSVAHHSYSTGNLRELDEKAVVLRRDANSSDSSLTRCENSPNLPRRHERASSTRSESPRKSRQLQLEVPNKHMSLHVMEVRGDSSSCLALSVPSKTNVVAPWEGSE